jgi:nitrite reductase/ring-hydroxylating ferredoxin subunit/uncharacterized membrane protein
MRTQIAVERAIAQQGWLEQAGKAVQSALRPVFRAEPGRRVKDFLHGTWLGHPLHVVLVDIPTGAWTTTLLLDVLGRGKREHGLQRGADASLAFGLLGAVGSALTGLADWSQTSGQTRRVGLVHAMFNTTAALLYTASMAQRLRGRRGSGVTLSTAGYASMLAGAYLGGELVFRLGTGVNRNAWTHGPEQFRLAMREDELQEGKPARVRVNGADVMLVRQRGEIFALDNTCSHEGGPLAEGKLADGAITCPWHGSTFRLADGSVVHGPASSAQRRYQVRVQAGNIEVRQEQA